MREWLKEASPDTPRGMGDDCASVSTKEMLPNLVTTVDSLVYRWHFDDQCPAEAAGLKLVKRNLSDIAAKGAIPHHAVVALLLPPNLKFTWLKGFYEGLRQACKQFNLYIAGGDISECPPGFFSASMTINGSTDVLKSRFGAAIGDFIYITGDLGGSICGKHLNFMPRLSEGRFLAAQQAVSAMIDVTDGLSKDLKVILPEKSAAFLDIKKIPYSEACIQMAPRSLHKRFQHAFADGEDYEILFTLKEGTDTHAFEQKWKSLFSVPITCIGTIGKQQNSLKFINHITGKRLPRAVAYQHLQRT